MTEIVEYSLVVMVSTLFIAGSVITYNSFSSFESGLQLRAAFAAVSGLASQAIVNGTSRASLTLPASIIRCEGGSLSLSTGTATERERAPMACDFVAPFNGGSYVLEFSTLSSRLVLSVS